MIASINSKWCVRTMNLLTRRRGVVLGVSHEVHFLEKMLVSLEGGEVISRIKFIATKIRHPFI